MTLIEAEAEVEVEVEAEVEAEVVVVIKIETIYNMQWHGRWLFRYIIEHE